MRTLAFNKGWHLLYTSSKQEKKVAEQLAARNINHYLPIVKTTRKWSDRIKTLNAPLFPSYLFIYLEQLEDYYNSLEAKGALHYVRFGTQIARVADSIVNDLKIVINKGQEIEVSYTEFNKGEILTISDGPLTGLNCEVVQYKSKEMILVRVNLLKRNVLAEVPVHHLANSLRSRYT
jgi:transcription antitermination factor NusG